MESDYSNRIKREFFQVVDASVLLYGCTSWTLRKRLEKNYMGTLQIAMCRFKIILGAHPIKQLLYSHCFINHPRKTRKTCWSPLGKSGRTLPWISPYRHNSVDHPAKTYNHQLCMDARERPMAKEDQRNPTCQYALMMMMMRLALCGKRPNWLIDFDCISTHVVWEVPVV